MKDPHTLWLIASGFIQEWVPNTEDGPRNAEQQRHPPASLQGVLYLQEKPPKPQSECAVKAEWQGQGAAIHNLWARICILGSLQGGQNCWGCSRLVSYAVRNDGSVNVPLDGYLQKGQRGTGKNMDMCFRQFLHSSRYFQDENDQVSLFYHS